MIIFSEKLSKSKESSSNSYVVIKNAVKDLLLPEKQHFFFFFFFRYVAGIVEPFFKKYQTDIPIIPFLYFDLKAVLEILML